MQLDDLRLRMDLSQLPESHLMAAIARAEWLEIARVNQIIPHQDLSWNLFLALAGRGFGKTRMAAEDSWWYAWSNPGVTCHVIAPTYNDLRAVCFEGSSGLIGRVPEICVANYNRSLCELRMINGSVMRGYSAQEPNRFRGPQCHYAWGDELAAWDAPIGNAQECLDMLLMGLRLGTHSRGVFTTTPRPLKVIKDLIKRTDVRVTTGTTFENLGNLSENFRQQIRQYEGTRLGRQELEAELLADVPGALWTPDGLELTRVRVAPRDLKRVVVGWDPSMTSGEDADEHGIMVVGIDNQTPDPHLYVLQDLTANLPPTVAVRRVIEAYHSWQADLVVGEANQGGDMLESLLRVVDPTINFEKTFARRGKYVRAEPVAALWERGVAHLVGRLDGLEDEMVAFTADQGGISQGSSPNRVDALVWAATNLMVQPGKARLIW